VSEERGIGATVGAMFDALNGGDQVNLGELFTEDAEFVGADGTRRRGRHDILALQAQACGVAKGSDRLELNALEWSLLADDVSLCHATWTRGGESKGTTVLVLTHIDSEWRIASSANIVNQAVQ